MTNEPAPEPDAPIPDEKDWTWVLDRPCPECGFEATELARTDIAPLIRTQAQAWQTMLASDADLHTRPSPRSWSRLELACHVRDVYALYDYRLGLMLDEDDPLYPNWDQDETAIEQRYHEQDPAAVGPALVAAASHLADRFAGLTEAQWTRPGRRSDGASFTVDSFARYLVHDPQHHLWDAAGCP